MCCCLLDWRNVEQRTSFSFAWTTWTSGLGTLICSGARLCRPCSRLAGLECRMRRGRVQAGGWAWCGPSQAISRTMRGWFIFCCWQSCLIRILTWPTVPMILYSYEYGTVSNSVLGRSGHQFWASGYEYSYRTSKAALQNCVSGDQSSFTRGQESPPAFTSPSSSPTSRLPEHENENGRLDALHCDMCLVTNAAGCAFYSHTR